MRWAGTKEGLIWIIIGGAIGILSWRISLGSFREPGAGFVAFASGLSLVLIGVIMTLSKTFPKLSSGAGRSVFVELHNVRLLYALGLLVGYGLVLETVGYIVATFLLMLGLFHDRGTNRLFPSILASAVTVGLTYLIFVAWLRVQLPRGILPW